MNQMLAIGETLSHLDLLVARGQAAVDTEGEIRYYRPAEPGPAAPATAQPPLAIELCRSVSDRDLGCQPRVVGDQRPGSPPRCGRR